MTPRDVAYWEESARRKRFCAEVDKAGMGCASPAFREPEVHAFVTACTGSIELAMAAVRDWPAREARRREAREALSPEGAGDMFVVDLLHGVKIIAAYGMHATSRDEMLAAAAAHVREHMRRRALAQRLAACICEAGYAPLHLHWPKLATVIHSAVPTFEPGGPTPERVCCEAVQAARRWSRMGLAFSALGWSARALNECSGHLPLILQPPHEGGCEPILGAIDTACAFIRHGGPAPWLGARSTAAWSEETHLALVPPDVAERVRALLMCVHRACARGVPIRPIVQVIVALSG